jgi:hypothetical protein
MKEKIVIHISPEVIDLVPGYISHRLSDIPLIREHLNNGRFEEIKVMGHKMKGGGGLYNMDQVTILGDKIEKAAIAKESAVIEEAVGLLEEYLNSIEVV